MKLINLLFFTLLVCHSYSQDHLYVSTQGSDLNKGATISNPFKTINKALWTALNARGRDVIIEVRGGKYYPDEILQITSADYQCRSLKIRSYKKETVIISGSKKQNLKWTSYKNGIQKAKLDVKIAPDRFYYNGKAMPMARYPNFNAAAIVFNGTAEDAISEKNIMRWKDPAGGFIHALHNGRWGGMHFSIIGKTPDGKLNYEGGWQNNRPSLMHEQYRFVENIFEELDAPGEWYYDAHTKSLYFFPPAGTDINKANIETGSLQELIIIKGNEKIPVKNITISNIHFTQTDRSFMLTEEPLVRSDWTIYRGGAVLLENTENVSISNCSFYELGGNAVFISNYNKNTIIKDNNIYNIGASAIAFVGNPGAVRSPSFRYEEYVQWNEMDYTPGPKSNNYPQYCTAYGNLIHHIGLVEKQSAGVQIEMSSNITVSQNSIYNTPRAGINIGDGCWGGHVIEFNEVFNTVLETGDHGAFNSWGRDRFWRPERNIIDSIVNAKSGIELLDAISPVIIRNNRFQCDHGWDIDLDDGSSNYIIKNNICLSGGLKLREGYYRTVTNNIIINNSFHPHVWLKNSHDIFMNNIITTEYAPILMDNWGDKIDSNYFTSYEALASAQQAGLDKNSLQGDPLFINAATGNYTLKPESSAFNTGFKNITGNVGVTNVNLKKIAKHPLIMPLLAEQSMKKDSRVEWLGGFFKNVETLGEQSAAGLPDMKGALLVSLPAGSIAVKNGMKKGDVIVKLNDQEVSTVIDLLKIYQSIKWVGRAECTFYRNQAIQKVNISFNPE